MSMQQGANTVKELLEKVGKLAKEMQDFSDCDNTIREIEIRIDEEDNSFIITSDWYTPRKEEWKMCEDCGEKEDEYLLEIRKKDEVIATKRVCEDCFHIIINDEN